MIFITVGIFILVISFVLALISLVREQGVVGGQMEDNVDQTPILNQDQNQEVSNQNTKPPFDLTQGVQAANEDQSQIRVQDTARAVNGQYPVTNKKNRVQPTDRQPFFWEKPGQAIEVRDVPASPQVTQVPKNPADDLGSSTLGSSDDNGLDFSKISQSPLKGDFSVQDLVAERQKDKSPS